MKIMVFFLAILISNQMFASQGAVSAAQTSAVPAKISQSRKIMAACAIIPSMDICVVHIFAPQKQAIPLYIRLMESKPNPITAELIIQPPHEHLTQQEKLPPLQRKLFNAARQSALIRIERTPSKETLRTFLLFDDMTMEEPFLQKR